MDRHIAIIDSDPIFARCISQRLQRLIPSTRISLYTPDDLKSGSSLLLTEEVILYDETQTDPETLRKHTNTPAPPCLIPLKASGSELRSKMTGTELFRRVQNAAAAADNQTGCSCEAAGGDILPALTESRDPGGLSCSEHDRQNLHRSRGHLRMLISFADRSGRELYAARSVQTLLTDGFRIIRIDLMPGISMTNPFRRKNGAREQKNPFVSGISELLLQLENTAMEPKDLLNYVQMGQDGCFHFGLPLRSDDIVCCRPELVVRLLCLLRRMADTPEENTAVIVVAEGLPFQMLHQICPVSHELHVIMPPKEQIDHAMCDWELNELFSSLPPGLLKFISETERHTV